MSINGCNNIVLNGGYERFSPNISAFDKEIFLGKYLNFHLYQMK